MKTIWMFLLLVVIQLEPVAAQEFVQAGTANGMVEGVRLESGILTFRGIPYAAPPVRENRWRPPQPVKNWEGTRKADRFADQCMQARVFGDMMFRNSGVSEDCLYLNVWTPKAAAGTDLPVLVYFYGGGLIAGDGSEPRYDGESMARRGIVVVTMSYRLGVFGFMAHPELTAESPDKASGNYGLLDQLEALRWVKANIRAFGGDPNRVTIGGESAGSRSVSAHMASPLTRGLIHAAIGESGSVLGMMPPLSLAESEKNGLKIAELAGQSSLAGLRALSATELLEISGQPGVPRPVVTIDGYFLPAPPLEIYGAGRQAHIPLLVGWNSEENNARTILGDLEPTPENFERAVRALYTDRAEDVLKLYRITEPDQVIPMAMQLATDRSMGINTWRWYDRHRRTGGSPVYRYFYVHPRPPMRPEMGDATPGFAGGVIRGGAAGQAPQARGAVHSAEIEYALGNLESNAVYAWTEEDVRISETMQGFFVNFIKTGNPNGKGLPEWPAAPSEENAPGTYMRIDVTSQAVPDDTREQYRLMDELLK